MTSEENDDLTPPTAPEVPTAPEAPAPPTAPAAPPAPEPVKQKKHTTAIRVVAGLAVALVVILLKVGAIAGIVHLFNGNDHKAKDAEKVVDSFMSADLEADALKYVTSNFAVDKSCDGTMSAAEKYKIESSSKESDGSADVAVKFNNGSKAALHLVDSSGWKIDKITCK